MFKCENYFSVVGKFFKILGWRLAFFVGRTVTLKEMKNKYGQEETSAS
ncbi:hypothetical protein ACFLW4_03255 [Chloroflexota bacterium]